VRTVSAAFLARWMDLRGMTVEDLSLGGGRDSNPGGTVISVRKAITARSRGGGRSGGGGGGSAARGGGQRALAVERAAAQEIAGVGASAEDEALAASAQSSSWGQQFWWTFQREIIMITRNPADVAGRTLTNTWVAATMGLLYYDIPNEGGSLKCKVNMLLNILAFFCLMPYISMSLYTASKQFYLADVSAKLYTPSAYYVAKVGTGLRVCTVGWAPGAEAGQGGVGRGLPGWVKSIRWSGECQDAGLLKRAATQPPGQP
jgi:hypothetical protein